MALVPEVPALELVTEIPVVTVSEVTFGPPALKSDDVLVDPPAPIDCDPLFVIKWKWPGSVTEAVCVCETTIASAEPPVASTA